MTVKLQYTIRDVPPEVDLKLRAAAVEQGISLNKLLLQKLGATQPKKAKRYHDLDWMFGSMPAAEAQQLHDDIMTARAEARAQAVQEYEAELGRQA